MPVTIDGSLGITTPMYNGAIASNAVTPSVGMKNRIINGAMVIDQRNAGASVTPTGDGTYTLDRWRVDLNVSSKYSVQRSTTAPVGFSNSLLITSTSSYSVGTSEYFGVNQLVEGHNISDLAWGTANAKTVTLSFWIRSSLTGTFGGAIRTGDGSNYSYPFSYTISSANTWEYKTITIPGPTSGTWGTGTSVGLDVWFSLGTGATYTGTAGAWAASNLINSTGSVSVVGTNGATWYLTGVQLEVGSAATAFDYRQYGTELALCQRYYEVLYNGSGTTGIFVLQYASGIFRSNWFFKQEKRASATVALASGSSWGSVTPSIQGGISEARLDSTQGTYSVGTANAPSLYASAEL